MTLMLVHAHSSHDKVTQKVLYKTDPRDRVAFASCLRHPGGRRFSALLVNKALCAMSGLHKAASQGDMKQKSIMGWFKPGGGSNGAPSTPSSSAKSKSTPFKPVIAKVKSAPTKATSSKSSVTSEFEMIGDSDEADAPSKRVQTPKTPKTPARAHDIPPSSSPVDVGMDISDTEGNPQESVSTN